MFEDVTFFGWEYEESMKGVWREYEEDSMNKAIEVVERCVETPCFQLKGLRESGLELPEVNQIEAL